VHYIVPQVVNTV